MLKAVAKAGDTDLIILGLSFGNLQKFLAEPGDTFIKIKGEELGIHMDIMIFSGRTEAHLAELMEGVIGPDTKVHISPKIKT